EPARALLALAHAPAPPGYRGAAAPGTRAPRGMREEGRADGDGLDIAVTGGSSGRPGGRQRLRGRGRGPEPRHRGLDGRLPHDDRDRGAHPQRGGPGHLGAAAAGARRARRARAHEPLDARAAPVPQRVQRQPHLRPAGRRRTDQPSGRRHRPAHRRPATDRRRHPVRGRPDGSASPAHRRRRRPDGDRRPADARTGSRGLLLGPGSRPAGADRRPARRPDPPVAAV
ncbi:MAG: hypothetical protein AVDCRST_MAG06-632, partial [uncultured Nocardioides sp.]